MNYIIEFNIIASKCQMSSIFSVEMRLATVTSGGGVRECARIYPRHVGARINFN